MATADTPIIGYQPGGGVPVPGGGDLPAALSAIQSGVMQLVNNQSYINVAFPTAQPNKNWQFLECQIINTTDPDPLNIWPGIVNYKTKTGFTLQLNGKPDSDNYFIYWTILGATVAAAPPATTYSLSGPSSGGKSVPSTFFVALPAGTSVETPVTVTPNDGGAGGTFSPTAILLTAGGLSISFTYTPTSYGARTISVANDGALMDPGSITFTSVASSYTLTGPSGGAVAPSTPFTVALPVGSSVLGTVTVTPNDGGGGGTFTPTTVGLTTAAPSATFTYTPTSGGAKTISVTNNGSLTNPAALTYTVLAVFLKDNFTDTDGVTLPAHTMDVGPGWTRFEGSGANQMTIVSNKANSFTDAGSAYAYQSESGHADCTIQVTAIFGSFGTSHYCQIVFRYSDANNWWTLRTNGSGNMELVKKVAGAETVVSSTSFAPPSPFVLKVVLSGTSISVFVNTVNLTTTDAFNQTATKHGMRSYETFAPHSTFDDFTAQ